MIWTKETPIIGGWYKHRKNGIESMLFLKPYGFAHPHMPDGVLFAMTDQDSNSGKNIICDADTDFLDCEWLGPLSEAPEKQWLDSPA